MNRVTAIFLPVASRSFVTLDLDGASLAAEAGAYRSISRWDDAVVRVRYTATEEQARRIDHAEITRALMDSGAHKVFAIQPTIVRENRARVEGVTEEIAPLAAVGAWCDANGIADHAPLGDLTSRYLQDVVA
jgi:hypothetical protein